MAEKPQWKPMDFTEVERRLTEARDLLAQAARLMEAREMEKVSTLAEMHLTEEMSRRGHANRRRYR